MQEAARDEAHLTVADLQRAAMLGQDLLDDSVKRDAWS